MKFGRNLPRNQVPQWASQYIHYKELKKLIKTAAASSEDGQDADLADFFFQLDLNLDTVDAHYNRTYAELARRLRLLYDRYGEDAPLHDRSERQELGDVVNALLDLRTKFRNLQWYAEVNRRGFTKILKKLDKKVSEARYQKTYLASQVEPKPFATNHDLMANMASINLWLSKASNVQHSSGTESNRSSFSIPRPLQTSLADLTPQTVDTIDNALMDNNTTELDEAIQILQQATDDEDSTMQRLLLNFLQRAIYHSATDCIPFLLKRIGRLDDVEDFHQRNCFHRLLINIGRARTAKAGHQTVEDSPDIQALGSSTIAPAAAPLLDLNPYGMKEVESSRLINGDETAKIVKILLDNLSEVQVAALTSCDDFGRLPLHYAAKYGFVDVCQDIMQKMMACGHLDTRDGLDSIKWKDTDGSTPLHLAVIGGWRLTVEIFLEKCKELPGLDPTYPLRNWSSSNDLLRMATRANFPKIVGLLVGAGADPNIQDEQGEAALHVAARFGHIECAEAILDGPHLRRLDLNIAEKTYGWTPVLIASVDGQLPMVRLLVNSGADLQRLDGSGWTAKEHAALRGHMEIAQLLAKHTPRSIPPSPKLIATVSENQPRPSPLGDRGSSGISKESINQRPVIPPIKSYGHRYLQEDCMALVSLGSMDARKNQKPIELDSIPLAEAHATQLDTALSVVVSSKGATGEPYIVDLPVEDNISTEPFTFMTKDISKVRLFFDIVPTYSGTNDEKVGRAVAMLSSVKPSVGSKRINLQGDVSVPILGTKNLEVIGMVNFNFLIITPFKHENIIISESLTYWKTLTSPMVIGHRGLGKNLASRKSLQLGENTIQSFIAAANLGATYVEFDVQLTKDHVPVIYHDFLVSETGIDAPVHTLTLEQFLHVNDSMTPRPSRPPSPTHRSNGHTPSTNGNGEGDKRRPQRAMSLSAAHNIPTDMSERMKHTRDFKLKGYKGNSRGNFIQAPFATLEEMFRKLPESTGFNIEMKYPMLFESEAEEMDTYAVELNEFVDTVLKMVYDLAGKRNIIFSSFHPDICLLLSLKQPNIPILFLTDAGTSAVGDIRASSLQEAIRFASRWKLLGVVSAAEPLVMCPRLVRVVKESGLVCVSYGTLNNEPENVTLQVNEGIDAVIVDNVLAVRKGLTAGEVAKTVESGGGKAGVNLPPGGNGQGVLTINGVPLNGGSHGAVV